MKTRWVLAAVVVAFAVLATRGCPNASSGGAGAGGIQLSTLYRCNSISGTISQTGFSNGLGPFTVPTGHGAFDGCSLRIGINNTSGSTFKLMLTLSASSSTPGAPYVYLEVPNGASYSSTVLLKYDDLPEGSTFKIWQDPGSGSGLSGVTLNVSLEFWLFNMAAAP